MAGAGGADTLAALPGVVDVNTFGERLHVTLDGAHADAVERFTRALTATPLGGVPVRQIPPSLEDVFIARLGGKESLRA